MELAQKKLKVALVLLFISIVVIQVVWLSTSYDYLPNKVFKLNNLTKNDEQLPAFVTGFSDNHMNEGIHLLDDFINTFGNSTSPNLIFYNLGLKKDNLEKLIAKYGHRVQLRTFDVANYPKYVRNLKEYRWKPLIISECLKEFHGVWWMDSSVTFRKDFAQVYEGVIGWVENTKWSMSLLNTFWPSTTGHSIHAATNPGLYKLLPIPEEKSKQLVMYGATTMLVMKSNNSEFIVKQWVKCALEKECMAPTGSELYCKFKDRMNDYAKCHRYDQSAINVLLAMNSDYDVKKYVYQGYCGLKVVRR